MRLAINWKNLFIPRRVWQALGIESRTLDVLRRHGLPDVMLQFLGGLGDELLLSCVARELKKRSPGLRIWQVSSAADLLRNNPDYAHVFSMDHWYLRYSNLLGARRLALRYTAQPVAGEQEIPPTEHIVAHLCRAAGITGEIEVRPYHHQSEAEKRSGKIHEKQVCIQSIGEYTHETWMRNKLWFHDRFQAVVDELGVMRPDVRVIQIGVAQDHPLSGVTDLRGGTGLRETAAILSRSLCFIGTQGFLAHLARAVDCRSVIVFGGREHSWQSGYGCNENLDSFTDCAPCWRWNACDQDRRCMDMIGVEEVLAAVLTVLGKSGSPPEEQTVFLG
ncbi:MAG TPA: hypothetical protein VN260_02615 [Dissulfurispiraceae bacterium]|nr:hypothetical protein [Dissulfurispiraceae bacterium]